MRRRSARLLSLGRCLALAVAMAAAGCSELGNPGLDFQRTPPTVWTDGRITLETRSLSVPPARSNELLRAIAPAAPHHLDTVARAAGAVTLVIVAPDASLLGARGVIPLVTELHFADGSSVRRAWAAPAGAPRFYAGFGVPSWPTSAVTRLATP